MPMFRVCATSRQTFTQHFEVQAATPEEALDLVKSGDVEITHECFEDVEDVEPFVVHRMELERQAEDRVASPTASSRRESRRGAPKS